MQIYASNGTGYDSVIEPSYMTQFENQSSGKPAKLIKKNITENGEYSASSDNVDGYSKVNVNVPNTYTVNDNGKVVTNQELVAQTAYPDTVTTNNTYDTTNYNSITVDVANTYTNEDEGKVVDNGALVAQTAMAEEITENGVVDTTLYNSVTVNVAGSGGSFGNDVIFYDYDGTVITSYSAADFANLSAMPANPTHEGLTAQGWNWSLADAKAYVAAYGKLNIGQMYITSDGKTRLYCTIPKDNLALDLYLILDEDTELDIDWGDGSTHTTWASNDGDSSKTHEYASAGRYVIAIEVITGGFIFSQGLSNIYKVEIGNGVENIGGYAFNNCQALSSITMPNSIINIGNYAFESCYALSSIIIPDSVFVISEHVFSNCYSLSSVAIPRSVIGIGKDAFECCYALSSIIIPDNVTSISDIMFQSGYALSSITIPDSVTSIGTYIFYECYALLSITIPNGVTDIGSHAFDSCSALLSITFESSTPPSLGSKLDIPTTCIIRVPQGSLSAYTSATNYPDPSEYIYEEY